MFKYTDTPPDEFGQCSLAEALRIPIACIPGKMKVQACQQAAEKEKEVAHKGAVHFNGMTGYPRPDGNVCWQDERSGRGRRTPAHYSYAANDRRKSRGRRSDD